ncbi:hypothetical protein MXB_1849 [Myxobolus squamalis]|nr:hypothetical protein MXB_1849 [Myxobolus squamalis]
MDMYRMIYNEQLFRQHNLLPDIVNIGTIVIYNDGDGFGTGRSHCHQSECWDIFPVPFRMVYQFSTNLTILLCVPNHAQQRCRILQIFKDPEETEYIFETSHDQEIFSFYVKIQDTINSKQQDVEKNDLFELTGKFIHLNSNFYATLLVSFNSSCASKKLTGK